MLELNEVHTYYGTSHILQGISFSVPEGKCFALLGRNGVGKTTTIHSIAGPHPSPSGRNSIQGKFIERSQFMEDFTLGDRSRAAGKKNFPVAYDQGKFDDGRETGQGFRR